MHMMCVYTNHTHTAYMYDLWLLLTIVLLQNSSWWPWPSQTFQTTIFSAVLVPLPISKPGGLGWFALRSCSDCTPGQGSWALICSETTRISLVSRFWSALMWSIFMAFLRTWVIVILEKDLDSHLHIAQVFRLFQPISASSIGEPPLQYPFNFFTCRMAGQQCCTAAPSAPKRARGLSCVVFLPYGIVMDRNYRIVR